MKHAIAVLSLILFLPVENASAFDWSEDIAGQPSPSLSTVLSSAMLRRYLTDTEKEIGVFEDVALLYEQNETDGEADVLLQVESEQNIRLLIVFNNQQREILRLRASVEHELGFVESLLESSEPSIEQVQQMFPEGLYTVAGFTYDDDLLISQVELSYEVLPAPAFFPDNVEIDRTNARVDWLPEPGATGYIVEIEAFDGQMHQLFMVGPDVSGFTLPPELLVPGLEYEICIGTLNERRNLSSAESTFLVR